MEQTDGTIMESVLRTLLQSVKVKEKLGEKNAKQIYMSHYADMYTREVL